MADFAPSEPGTPAPVPVFARLRGGLGLTFRSLRHRDYRLYFFGQLVSLTGSWAQAAALMALAYDLTGGSTWPSILAAAGILPGALLAPWGGALADHWPKRSLIIRTQYGFLAVTLVLTGLVLVGAADPWTLLCLTVATGAVSAIDMPARLAFVKEMVGREDLPNAVALNSLLFNVARALGPVAAAQILHLAEPLGDTVGVTLCFALNAVSYLAVLVALARMRVGNTVPPHEEAPPVPLWHGFHYLAARPQLGLLVVLASSLALFGWPTQSLVPAYTRQILLGGEWEYGLTLSGIGVGALVAALVLAAAAGRIPLRWFLALGVCLVGSGLLLLSWTTQVTMAVLGTGLLGFGMISCLATCQSLVQLGVDDRVRGRVMGVWLMALSGAQPLGSFLVGPAADWLGVAVVLRIQGIGCLAAGVGLRLLAGLLRRRG